MIACACAVCRSTDPRDKRLRPSIYITLHDGTGVLVDTGPDLRTQALRAGISRVDAILFTHGHVDHLAGLDDVRRYNIVQRSPIPCYADRLTIAEIKKMFGYAFDPNTPRGGGIPDITLTEIAGPFRIAETEIVPIPVLHGKRQVLAYRVGRFAYATDCSAIPDASWRLFDGVDVLVIDGLREQPHPTHFSLSEAINASRRIGAVRTYFTHMTHDLGHADTNSRLPPGFELAYDGLQLDI
jgi:phosphoribosyl 1,2-cyclic phosphate phosphodiesterase